MVDSAVLCGRIVARDVALLRRPRSRAVGLAAGLLSWCTSLLLGAFGCSERGRTCLLPVARVHCAVRKTFPTVLRSLGRSLRVFCLRGCEARACRQYLPGGPRPSRPPAMTANACYRLPCVDCRRRTGFTASCCSGAGDLLCRDRAPRPSPCWIDERSLSNGPLFALLTMSGPAGSRIALRGRLRSMRLLPGLSCACWLMRQR